jgi:hypothetical protein
MLRYRQLQPKVQELCARYRIPYAQENVFARVRRMVDVVVGNSQMKVLGGVRTGDPAVAATASGQAGGEEPSTVALAGFATRP